MHNIPDFLRITPEMQEHFAKGGMIKRADGSYSRRGLWDNIRANKGSGKKPTREMLEQEAKIRAEEQYGGLVEEFGNGGYTVRRSHDRKGKTHVVIGPDGTKKYFGDAKLGQHPRDPERKKAFYARHKHNLAHNPYFRAFARATWEDGGEVPHFDNGGSYGPFYNRRDAAKMQRWRNPTADSMTPSFFAMGGLNEYQDGSTVDYNTELAKWKKEHGEPTYSTNGYLATQAYPKDAQFIYNVPINTRFGKTPIAATQAPAVIAKEPSLLGTGERIESIPIRNIPSPVNYARIATSIPTQPKVAVKEESVSSKPGEYLESAPTRAMPISNNGMAKSIPTSLIKPVPVTKSYLENTYESTEGIPKTVLQFFDTKKDVPSYDPTFRGRVPEIKTNVIFDSATKQAYEREYNPETGKFKIKSYKIRPSQLKLFTENPIAYTGSARNLGIGYINDTINNPSPGCKAGECEITEDGTVFFTRNPTSETDPVESNGPTSQFTVGKDYELGFRHRSPIDTETNFITINSDKSFDDNAELIKNNRKKYNINSRLQFAIPNRAEKLREKLNRNLTEEEIKNIKSEAIAEFTNNFNPDNEVYGNSSRFYVPEMMDENPLIEAYRNGIAYAPTEAGVKEYFRDNNKNRKVQPDDPFDNPLSFEERLKNDPLREYQKYLDEYKQFIENEQNKKRNGGRIYRNGGRALGRYQNGNIVSLNTPQPGVYNLGQMGPGSQGNYQTTNYSTNIGQPASGNYNLGTLGPTETANTGQGANTTSIASNDMKTQQAVDATNKTQDNNSNNNNNKEETSNTKADTSLIGSLLSKFDSVGMAGKAFGQLSDAMSSGLAATNILSRTFGNSEQNAALKFNRKQDNPTNYLNKVSNSTGIQYAKNGGTMGQYKEGDEIELTPTQMYLLEKRGYKFQII